MATKANAEAIEAWDGPLYDRFVRFREILTTGLAIHGEEALRMFPPQPGWQVLDIGCGFGDTTHRIAGLVGPGGAAVGVDAAERFIETAREEAAEAGVGNTSFAVADIQVDDLGGPYDMAFSRFGTMFVANPVAALRNVRGALRPGARLVMVVWRRREDNHWMHRPQTIVEQIVSRPEEYDEPTCGPGPFSTGHDVEEAMDLAMALGPAGEILRLQGERAAHLHGKVREALREGMSEFEGPDGLRAPSSTWIVSATAP